MVADYDYGSELVNQASKCDSCHILERPLCGIIIIEEAIFLGVDASSMLLWKTIIAVDEPVRIL